MKKWLCSAIEERDLFIFTYQSAVLQNWYSSRPTDAVNGNRMRIEENLIGSILLCSAAQPEPAQSHHHPPPPATSVRRRKRLRKMVMIMRRGKTAQTVRSILGRHLGAW